MGKVSFEQIEEKVQAGERLNAEEALFLFETNDLPRLGRLANLVRERINGNLAYFIHNHHINPTNVCVGGCNFCAFATMDPNDPQAWMWSVDQIEEKLSQEDLTGVTEFHIVGGIHPDFNLDYYADLFRMLKRNWPHITIKALTAVEIEYVALLSKTDYATVLRELREAGLDSMPGGGAEIFHPEVRQVICPGKADAEQWLEIHRTAHQMGIRTNCTMLYGHIEKPHHKVDHLLRLRELQDETGGFMTFIPLVFHPEGTELARKYNIKMSTGANDLKHIAIARLVLDNIPHIKSYWVQLTPGLAQVALGFGADDMDGTVVEEHIYHAAGAKTPQALTVGQLIDLIRAAGRQPVRRDTFFNILEVYAEDRDAPPVPIEVREISPQELRNWQPKQVAAGAD